MIKAIGILMLIIGNLSYSRKEILEDNFKELNSNEGMCQWPKNGSICGRPTYGGKVYCNAHLHGS